VQQSGMGSLYVGLSASLLRQMSYSLVRLGAYDAMKSQLSKDKQATTGSLFLAACLAGGMGGIAGNPAGVLPARMNTP
jgi:dicarboxylate transporter 10